MQRTIARWLTMVAIACAHFAHGQWQGAAYIDSMARQLPRHRDDTGKAHLLYLLATACFGGNPDKGLAYGKQGIDLAGRLGWKPGLVKLHNTMGNLESVKQNNQAAVDHYLKSLKYAEELHDMRSQAVALRNTGNIYSYRIKDYQKAIDYYLKCAAIDEKLGDNREAADVLSEAGHVCMLRKEYQKATDYYQDAQARAESAADNQLVGEQLTHIAVAYQSQGKYAQALDNIQRAQKFYEAANDRRGIAVSLLKAGGIYTTQKDYARALDCFQHALKLAEAARKNSMTEDILENMADVYANIGDYSKTLQYSQRALDIAEKSNNKAGLGTNMAMIGKSYYAFAAIKGKVAVPDSLGSQSASTKLQRAHYYLAGATDLLKEIGDYEQLADAYDVLSKVQYMEGDKEGSRESDKQHTTYLESMYNQDKSTEVARKDMQYVFNKKQEMLKQESQAREMAMQKEMQLSALQHEYEMKQAAATSEKERQQLEYEHELKQRQIAFEYERKQAALEAKAALDKAQLEKDKALAAIRLKEARRERMFFVAGILMLGLFMAGMYHRFITLKKTKLLLEEKNRHIAREKETADRMRERAEASEKFKQMFLANMSHEIRTPMNAVSGMTEILLEKEPRADQVSYLQAISKSSDVLLHIINDILDLSKIEAGKMELEKIDFSLSETLQQVCDTLAHRADEKGLRLAIEIDEKVPDVVVGDPFRLNQVLMNLGGNAIKFTERGGVQFKITATAIDDSHADICFAINDTGIGIPADKIQTLFGNFAQVNSSDTRKYGGTGLGLSISKQLVEMHGGAITVESVQGSGSTFCFTIKYPKGSADKLAQRISQERETDGSVLNGLKILLADDNEYNRMVVTETLGLKADVEIDTAVNGEEALEAVKAKDYDVVLMDVQMPVMSGIDATIAIRSLPEEAKKKLPVIALTASTLREDIDKCLNCGMNSYVPKPFKAWQLIGTLAEVTGRKGQPAPHIAGTKASTGKEKKPALKTAGTITDAEYLHQFCEGDEARIKKYVAMYLKGVPVFLSKLTEARDARDKKEMALRIHAFKPNWLIMGMKVTGDLGSHIERQCAEDGDEVFERVNELLEHTRRSVEELEGMV